MSPHHFRKRPLQCCHIQPPSQPYRCRNVVRRTARLQLVQEPQALLRKRQRQLLGRATGTSGGAFNSTPATHCASICSARPATVGCSNKLRNGNSTPNASRTRDMTCVASSECPPNSKKLSCTPTRARAPALPPRFPRGSLPSLCVALHALPPQARSPAPATRADRSCRWASTAAPPATQTQPAPCTPAHFARNACAALPPLLRLHPHSPHKLPAASLLLRYSAAITTASRTGSCCRNSGFDFTQLNPIASHFHLLVAPSQKFDIAVSQITRLVSRAVQARARHLHKRVRQNFSAVKSGAIR